MNVHKPFISKPLVVFIINASLTESLSTGVDLFRQQYGDRFIVRVFATHDIDEEVVKTRTVVQSLEDADMVFLDVRGGGKAAGVCAGTLPTTRQPVALLLGGSPEIMALLRLGSFSMKTILEKSARKQADSVSASPNIAAMQRLMKMVETSGSILPFGKLKHAHNWARMMRYWQHGGGENIKNLLAFAAGEYLDIPLAKPPKPQEYPEYGLFDPLSDRFYDTLGAYRQAVGHSPEKPTVGLLFYGGMHFSQSLVPAKAFAKRTAIPGQILSY